MQADIAWSQPHHDGSVMYVPEPPPKLGGKVNIFLRIPRTSDVTSAWVRALPGFSPFSWFSVELHIYFKGGHGFGMNKMGLPSDRWIERFVEWLQAHSFL